MLVKGVVESEDERRHAFSMKYVECERVECFQYSSTTTTRKEAAGKWKGKGVQGWEVLWCQSKPGRQRQLHEDTERTHTHTSQPHTFNTATHRHMHTNYHTHTHLLRLHRPLLRALQLLAYTPTHPHTHTSTSTHPHIHVHTSTHPHPHIHTSTSTHLPHPHIHIHTPLHRYRHVHLRHTHPSSVFTVRSSALCSSSPTYSHSHPSIHTRVYTRTHTNIHTYLLCVH